MTNPKQPDGAMIERAKAFCKLSTRCFGEDGQPLSAEQMMVNFAEQVMADAEKNRCEKCRNCCK